MKKIILSISIFILTNLTYAQKYGDPMTAPVLREYGYNSIEELQYDMTNHPENNKDFTTGDYIWYKLKSKNSINLDENEYSIILDKKTLVIFLAIERQGHGVVQFFGPIKKTISPSIYQKTSNSK